MKKFLAVILALALMIPGLSAFAADSANVYVTISDGTGTTVLAQETVTVTDIDGDGALTINDALYAAHEAKYEGGAAAGFASGMTDYGLSLLKLWGDDTGSYGYYLNNASAWSLVDPVKDGDHISAFVYTDAEGWSDAYSFFAETTVSAEAGAEIALTLSAAAFDADWNPITVPVEGAVITVDGEATASVTDAEGKAVISIAKAGTYVISATSETQVLVPPVCIATVTGTAFQLDGMLYGALGVVLAAAVVIGVILVLRRRNHAK